MNETADIITKHSLGVASDCKPSALRKDPILKTERHRLMKDGRQASSEHSHTEVRFETHKHVANRISAPTSCVSPRIGDERERKQSNLVKPKPRSLHVDNQVSKRNVKMIVDAQPKQRFLRNVFAPSQEQAAKEARERHMARLLQPNDDIVVKYPQSHKAKKIISDETGLSERQVLSPFLFGPKTDKLRRKVLWQTYKHRVEMSMANRSQHHADYAKQFGKSYQILPDISADDWHAKPMGVHFKNNKKTYFPFHPNITKHAMPKPEVPPNLKNKRKPISTVSKVKLPMPVCNQQPINDPWPNRRPSNSKPVEMCIHSASERMSNDQKMSGDCLINKSKTQKKQKVDNSMEGISKETKGLSSTLGNIINLQCLAVGKGNLSERLSCASATMKDIGPMKDSTKILHWSDANCHQHSKSNVENKRAINTHIMASDPNRIKKASCQMKNKLQLKSLPVIMRTAMTASRKISSEAFKFIWQ